MKKLVTITFLVFTFFARAKETGGGVIVGNGAGFTEGLFQQSYQSLPLILENVRFIQNEALTEDEIELLVKIHAIAKNNSNKKDRLLFLSEKENPNFFKTAEVEIHRFAKTFSNADAPIFINIDWLYTETGKNLSHAAVIALLVHEIGHQAGEMNHNAHDILGAKVKNFSNAQSNQYNFQIFHPKNEKTSISFVTTNLNFPKKNSLLRFKNQKNQWTNLSPALFHSIKCKKEEINFEVSNGHFSYNHEQILEFRAWVNYTCGNSESLMDTLKIKLDQNFEITGLIVE